MVPGGERRWRAHVSPLQGLEGGNREGAVSLGAGVGPFHPGRVVVNHRARRPQGLSLVIRVQVTYVCLSIVGCE